MCKQKMLLIKPYAGRTNSATAPPLGLLYLASYIRSKDKDYDIKLMDMRVDKSGIGELLDMVKAYAPGIIGISVCSEEDEILHEISTNVKKIYPDIIIAAGGPHVTLAYNDILKDDCIDFLVIGEGEITFYELLECIRKDGDLSAVSGIAYRQDDVPRLNPLREFISELDVLPFPAWDLIDIGRYSDTRVLNMNAIMAGKRYMGLVTSRGCPYKCVYCHNIFGRDFRKRSAENIFKEIKILAEEHGIDEFQVYDDIFNLDKERVHELCDMIISEGLQIKFSFPNGVRGDILDEEILLKLKKAGTYMITFALESASKRIQELIQKNINKEKLLDNIKYADKIGLLTKCYFMIGFPGETEDEIKETIDFACGSPLGFAAFFIVTPQKGTRLYDMVKDKYPEFEIDFKNSYYYARNNSYEKTLDIPLKKMQGYAYRRFYCSPLRIIKLLWKMPRKIFLVNNFFKYISFFYVKSERQ